MTDVIATILGASQAGSLVAIIWLVYRLVTATDALADARVAQSTTDEHCSELAFRLAQVQLALAKDDAVIAVDSKEIADANAKPPNPDLAPGDKLTRVQRMLEGWAADDAARADHAAAAAAVLPPPGGQAATAPGANPGRPN